MVDNYKLECVLPSTFVHLMFIGIRSNGSRTWFPYNGSRTMVPVQWFPYMVPVQWFP